MTNFDFLQSDPKFSSFAETAAAAEQIYPIDAGLSAMNCRRAMEFAVKWMYSVDGSLSKPWDDRLASLMSTEDFHDIVDGDLWKRLDFIRKIGNQAAHGSKKVTGEQAMLCLENLFIFMDFIAYCYGEDYTEKSFSKELVKGQKAGTAASAYPLPELDLEALIKENKELKEELTARRQEQLKSYVPKPVDCSEYETRRLYIDAMLTDAGWVEGENWLNEVRIFGIPSKSGAGRADYVLYGKDGRVLAVVEAKGTCEDLAKGRHQAGLYAEALERVQGFKPVVFLTNGFETRIIDDQYPERRVASVYSPRDLEKLFNLRKMRDSLLNIRVDRQIAGRYYQEAAVKAVCDSFGKRNRRRALLVMATGSGKTRTVIALCDVLLKKGWVRNILFLADRNSLVTQAKRSFVGLLPDLSCVNLCEDRENVNAHCIFSTYQTMMNSIDSVRDEKGKLFTCGHFDLIICDEAHRSIYNKYRDIFNYFDAPLVGLTATPKDEIDKNTYQIFELQAGIPTYGYELAQAVKDGFLVDFLSVETKLKFIDQGIAYDELSKEEQEVYEETFKDMEDHIPERICPSAMNQWIFNEDTIRRVLRILMDEGLKIEYGSKLGKTVIFARNHEHAEKILDIFGKEYPHLKGYAQVIDNKTSYVQSAIDQFSDPLKLPQIAVSVDMLDTGIDVPEVLNLVFFKKVLSKAKFWQMIGRGTRLCPGLMDGADKDKFYIFDFCGNFEFFRMSQGRVGANVTALQGAIFNLEFEMAYRLQDLQYQTERLSAYRRGLVAHMAGKARELDRENFAVRQHLRYVERYSNEENYTGLTYEDTLTVKEELAPLILPEPEDFRALRFDALVYGIELAILAGRQYGRGKSDLLKKAEAVAGVAHIPEIMAQADMLGKLLHTDYLERAGIEELEEIRESLRGLMKYIPKASLRYDTDFNDEILCSERKEAELENDDLKNYRAKAEYYVRCHQDNPVIAKLRGNVPLSGRDVKALEEILWEQVGTRQDYEAEYGKKPLGEFVREIVGLDMAAAKAAFGEYLEGASLDSRQIYFVNQIVEYIVRNGMMKDLSVLQEAPFTDQGSIVDIFADMSLWLRIRGVIDEINANATAA